MRKVEGSPIPPNGLSLWLKADAGVTTSGSNVTAWADQSGNGRNATPVDVSPTLNSSDLNSKPTISLSSVAGGTNKSLQISGNPMGASGATAFVVNYVDQDVFPVDGEGGDANGALLGNFGDAQDGSHWPYGISNPVTVYDSFATDTRKDDLGLPSGITSWNIYYVHSQDDDYKLFCNGIQFHSDVSNVYSNAIANSTSLYIGMQNNAGTDQIFKGKIAEVVIYNRVLTTPERRKVESYLGNKYGISVPISVAITNHNFDNLSGLTDFSGGWYGGVPFGWNSEKTDDNTYSVLSTDGVFYANLSQLSDSSPFQRFYQDLGTLPSPATATLTLKACMLTTGNNGLLGFAFYNATNNDLIANDNVTILSGTDLPSSPKTVSFTTSAPSGIPIRFALWSAQPIGIRDISITLS